MEVRAPERPPSAPRGPQTVPAPPARSQDTRLVLGGRGPGAGAPAKGGRWGVGQPPQTQARPSTALQRRRAPASSRVKVGRHRRARVLAARSLAPTRTPRGSDLPEPSMSPGLDSTSPNRLPRPPTVTPPAPPTPGPHPSHRPRAVRPARPPGPAPGRYSLPRRPRGRRAARRRGPSAAACGRSVPS